MHFYFTWFSLLSAVSGMSLPRIRSINIVRRMASSSSSSSRRPVRSFVEDTVKYHDATKHRLPNKFARSSGFMDWQHQPNPFRIYRGSENIALKRDESWQESGVLFDDLYSSAIEPSEMNHETISQFLFNSLAISAWKQAGHNKWSLRCNPSSGNLHPTEAYLFLPDIHGIHEHGDKVGLYHYSPLLHSLERRTMYEKTSLNLDDKVLIGLSSIHWRESWKYGERAFRYCQHDCGHAIAGLAYSAASLGWHVRLLDKCLDETISEWCGISDLSSGPEAEHPDCLLMLSKTPITDEETNFTLPTFTGNSDAFNGRANQSKKGI